MEKKDIEIPFGAFDSELSGFEYTIPEGYKAEIKDGKVLVRKTESDDERIRKDIVFYIAANHKDDEEKARWLYWLEKQGKKIEPIEDFDTEFERQISHLIASIINKEYSYTKAFVKWTSDALLNYTKHEIEKQGEQKPNYCHHEVDLSECSEEYRKAYYDGWNSCNMQHSQCKSELDDVIKYLINGMKFYYEDNEEATWGTDKWSMPVKHIVEVLEKQEQILANSAKTCKVEQEELSDFERSLKHIMEETLECGDTHNLKADADILLEMARKQINPAWDEDDELHIRELERLVKQVWTIAEHENDKETIHKMSDLSFFLKTLKPQLKQEWSEEDENRMDNLCHFLEEYGEQYYGYLTLQNTISWLKSLRPKKQWKPSEEQMEALDIAIWSGIQLGTWEGDALKSLAEQLKKLK